MIVLGILKIKDPRHKAGGGGREKGKWIHTQSNASGECGRSLILRYSSEGQVPNSSSSCETVDSASPGVLLQSNRMQGVFNIETEENLGWGLILRSPGHFRSQRPMEFFSVPP